ncbi:hypothetical protein F2Q69_00037232 [Brassica cretica]|uniref:Uncharacterized protein n=1 Tax=Brassica cretica TaxID=69181 RepID=A0A8S9SRS7_BRACR|nr:hypothetical protein F2Q69_00037232 [Brassica cretica]
MSPPCVSLRHLSRSVLLLRHAVFSLAPSLCVLCQSVICFAPNSSTKLIFRQLFQNESSPFTDLLVAVSHPWDLYEMFLGFCVLNTVASTFLLGGPLKLLNKGGSRLVPFTVKREDNNHNRDINQTGRQQRGDVSRHEKLVTQEDTGRHKFTRSILLSRGTRSHSITLHVVS